MLNIILTDIDKQRSISQINESKSFLFSLHIQKKIILERLRYIYMNALIQSTYLYSLGMSTRIRALNYRSVTTIIDYYFSNQLLDRKFIFPYTGSFE